MLDPVKLGGIIRKISRTLEVSGLLVELLFVDRLGWLLIDLTSE